MATTLGTLNPLRYRGYVYDQETGLYYLQSRYYNPEMGRFINADAQLNTDAILGYNMFGYYYNNPIMFADSLGTRPILGMSVATETKKQRMASCDYMLGKTRPVPEESLDAAEVAKEIAVSLWNNLEFSAGVGQGLYGELEVLDLVSAQIGMYGNYASVQLEDSNFRFGQELNQGISVSLFGHNLGINEYRFNENGVDTTVQENKGFYTDETWTIFSAGVYAIAGGSIRIGFDIIQFFEDLDKIFN